MSDRVYFWFPGNVQVMVDKLNDQVPNDEGRYYATPENAILYRSHANGYMTIQWNSCKAEFIRWDHAEMLFPEGAPWKASVAVKEGHSMTKDETIKLANCWAENTPNQLYWVTPCNQIVIKSPEHWWIHDGNSQREVAEHEAAKLWPASIAPWRRMVTWPDSKTPQQEEKTSFGEIRIKSSNKVESTNTRLLEAERRANTLSDQCGELKTRIVKAELDRDVAQAENYRLHEIINKKPK